MSDSLCREVMVFDRCRRLQCGPGNYRRTQLPTDTARSVIGRLHVRVRNMMFLACDGRIARAGLTIVIAQQTSCLYAAAGVASKLIISLSRGLGALSMRMKPARRMIVGILVASLSLMPASVHAGDHASNAQNENTSTDDQVVTIEERTQGATEGRQKAQESVNALSGEIQELKKSVIALNKNLRVLEEDLLFPADTQVNVFLSLDVGKFFTLESVKLKLDGQVVASHIYTDKELQALAKGGINKLHMANLSIGEHTLSAFFTGAGPSGRDYKRGTTLVINKENGPKYVELRITDSSMKLQPEFSVREW